MAAKRPEHPLALLFWSQLLFAYGLPVGLGIAYQLHPDTTPSHATLSLCRITPIAMAGFGVLTVAADFTRIYGCVIRHARRMPSVAVGAVYAIFVFVGYALANAGLRNAGIAWADYVVQGKTAGILVLLLGIVIEIFAATFIACQTVALARRWRRIARMPLPQAAE